MNNINFNTRGTAQNDDIYFQNAEVRNKDYEKVYEIVENYMAEVNKITGSSFKPFNYYGADDADSIIVAMGSVCDTTRETVDFLNSLGNKYGMIEVHLYRPFSKDYLLKVIPETVKNIAVLDRTKEAGSAGDRRRHRAPGARVRAFAGRSGPGLGGKAHQEPRQGADGAQPARVLP